MRPVIALLTDFGTGDHYAGTMKGVILGICPDATLVDITHDIPPHDVTAGALELAASYKYFPAGTIFVAVVDPGVGSARRGLAADTGDYRFVAPDNGVLTLVLRESPAKKIVELTERRYARPTVSRTFEGRDRFAPAAAWLAKGVPLEALGPAVMDPQRITLSRPEIRDTSIEAHVIHVDRFGNLITDLSATVLQRFVGSDRVRIEVGGTSIDRISGTYSDVAAGDICAVIGSTDAMEIACRDGSAASRLGVGRGAIVSIRRSV